MSAPEQFDPWSITLEAQLGLDLTEAQVLQCTMARGMAREREEIVKSGFAVMEAVSQCSRYGLVLPDWLASEFRRRFNAVKFHRAASWDDEQAFGRPYPKGAHLHRLRKERLWPEICWTVRELLDDDPNRAIDEALFDDVSERMRGLKGIENPKGLGRSECQRIYYEHVDRFNALFGSPENSEKFPVIRRRR